MSLPKFAGVSRRSALCAGVIAPMVAADAAAAPALSAAVDELLARCLEQARRFNVGDMEGWLAVADPGEGFTLMQPFGGKASYGFDRSPAHLARLSGRFRNGDASIEVEHVLASGDLVMLAYIERQQIEVAGLPRQDWSLRVTQVFQRQGSAWRLIHRHADPLVRPIPLGTAAALAAGRPLLEALAGE
jgi:hypothetical protein